MASSSTGSPKKNSGTSKKKIAQSKSGGRSAATRTGATTNPRGRRSPPRGQFVYTLLWLIPLISVILLLWMIVLNMGYIDSEEMFGIDTDQWFMLSIFIEILLIIGLILPVIGSLLGEPVPVSPTSSGTGDAGSVVIEAVGEEEKPKASASLAVELEEPSKKKTDLAEAKKEEVEPVKTAPKADVTAEERSEEEKVEITPSNILLYPTTVGTGLYGDTYIKIDKNKILKLRTLLIEEYYLL